MFRFIRIVDRFVKRIARAVVRRLAGVVARLWRQHRRQVVSNGAYAVAVGSVVAGCFGFMPLRDVLAAVLAAVLGCAVGGTRSPQRHQLHIDDLFYE